MKKGIVTVFIILGILVIALILWAVVFNKGGLPAAINAIATPINNIWQGMTGDSSSKLINITLSDLNQNSVDKAGSGAFSGGLKSNGALA